MTKTKSQRARAKQAKKGRSLPSKKNRSPKGKSVRKSQMSRTKMKGAGPKSIKVSTGRLGLSMSSGLKGATNRRSKICEEDEFVANVSGSATTSSFSISNTIACNPGLLASFPWLAGEASRYNEYEWEYLEYYFKRTVSEFATAGTTGKVLLFFDPDAADIPPTTKQQIEDSVYHNDGMPCDPVIRLPVDTARLKKNVAKYVRVQAAPANTDIKTYDVGNMYVACDSTATSGVIGELRVRYRIKFTVPILSPNSTVGGALHFSSIAATTANNFAAAALQSGGTPSLTGITLGSNTVTFPAGIPGNYFLAMNISGATSASQMSFSGGTALSLFTSAAVRDAASAAESLSSTTTNSSMTSYAVTIPTAGATITLSPATVVGTGSMDLFLFSLPSTVLTADEKEQVEIEQLQAASRNQSERMEQLETMIHKLVSYISNSGGNLQNVVELDSTGSDDDAATSSSVKVNFKKTRRFGESKGPGNPSLAPRIDIEECKEQSSSSKGWFGAK